MSAGNLPQHTNRAALAELLAAHPQISDSEWEFEAAAAAEWFADHERRLSLRSLGSWIVRVERRKRELERETARETEQETSHGSVSPRRRVSATGRRAPAAPTTIPHTPETDHWEPLDPADDVWESDEQRIRRALLAARQRNS